MIKNTSLSISMFLVLLFLTSCHSDNSKNPVAPIPELAPLLEPLELTQLSDSSLNISWKRNKDVTQKYVIESKTNNDTVFSILAQVSPQDSCFIATELHTETEYHFQLRGYNQLDSTNTISATLTMSFAPISDFTVTPHELPSLLLSWVHNCSYEKGYKLERRELSKDSRAKSSTSKLAALRQFEEGDSKNFEEIALLPEDTFQFIDQTAVINNSYEYRLSAYSDYNTSAPVTTEMEFVLVAPKNLSITPTSISSIELEWSDISLGESGYKLDRKRDNETWQNEYITLAADSEFFQDTELITGSTYTYRLYAFLNTAVSESISVETTLSIPAPTNFKANSVESSACELTWDYSEAGGETGFTLEKKIGESNWQFLAQLDISARSFIDSDLIELEKTEYKLYSQGNNSQSNVVTTMYMLTPEGFVFIPAGSFNMGDRLGIGVDDELPLHNVYIDSFIMSSFEITHEQFIIFLNAYGIPADGILNDVCLIHINNYECAIRINESNQFEFEPNDFAESINSPVIKITWYGAALYANYLSLIQGLNPCYDLADWSCNYSTNGYRLPTEAEWEFAARGGNQETDNYIFSGSNSITDIAWYFDNANNHVNEVGTKLPNQLGLYDMTGNACEWCNDWYLADYYNCSADSNPTGADSGTDKIFRGGSWIHDEIYNRVSNRNFYPPYYSKNYIGFRIIRAIQ